jgi:SAM-dependent methyltransferase
VGTDYDKFARFYDLEYRNVKDDLEFYRQFAMRCESPILELGCGSGRVLFHLARSGFHVTGIDLSGPMLDIARQQIAGDTRVARNVRLEGADMRSFGLRTRFRMAFCAINSFMHLLTTEDQMACLSTVHHHLVAGGLLIIDLFNPDLALMLEGGGRLMLERLLVDPAGPTIVTKMVSAWVDRANQVNHVTYLYDEMGEKGELRRTVASISQRYFYRYEMELLLQRAGFALEHVYGSYELDDYGPDSYKMIFVARREQAPAS